MYESLFSVRLVYLRKLRVFFGKNDFKWAFVLMQVIFIGWYKNTYATIWLDFIDVGHINVYYTHMMQCITCITIWCCKWFVQNLYHLKLNVKIFYTKLFYPWVIFASLHFKIVLPRLEFAQAQLCVNKNNWDNGIHEVLKGHGHGFRQKLFFRF